MEKLIVGDIVLIEHLEIEQLEHFQLQWKLHELQML